MKAVHGSLFRVAKATPLCLPRRHCSGNQQPKKEPFDCIKKDLESVAGHIQELVSRKDNQVIDAAASYLLQNQGKMLRPAIVCLAGYASLPSDDACRKLHGFTRSELLASAEKRDLHRLEGHPFNRHLRLAEVTELVHTASLVHDDVLDASDTRRGKPALHSVFGTKVAVLTGDYLLARASRWLATLGDSRVVMSMSMALEDLAVGEVMQMQGVNDLNTYMKKTFCKTSSLIAHACRGAAILSDPDNEECHEAIFQYGSKLGLAFQIVDDVLDFTSTDQVLGKPALNDLKSGIATLPILLAAQHRPDLTELIKRKFCLPSDVETAMKAIDELGTIEESKKEAAKCAAEAIEQLKVIPDSEVKESMIKLTEIVLAREK